jgi:GT2 family glycosyltransferase
MITTNDKVAIVILNWNSYDDTIECLNSLVDLDYPFFEVFLVDNGSKDNSLVRIENEYRRGKFPYIINILKSDRNLGFAGGNNIGIQKAYQENFNYFWLLNNDTTVDPNALNELINEIKGDSKVGIVGSKIYYYGTDIIWFAGGVVNKYTGKTSHIGFKEKDKFQYNNIKEVDYISGCSLLFKKELIETAGYMSEDYFLYYEETDWNLRAHKCDWKIKYVPGSIIYHKVSVSSGGENNLAPYVDYFYLRNCYIMIKRNQSSLSQIISLILLFFRFFKKMAKVYIFNLDRKKERIKYLFMGIKHGLLNKMGKHPTL